MHVVAPDRSRPMSAAALTADGKRGRSDKVIDNGIAPDEAARRIIDAVAANQREIIVAEGMEEAMGELRRSRTSCSTRSRAWSPRVYGQDEGGELIMGLAQQRVALANGIELDVPTRGRAMRRY